MITSLLDNDLYKFTMGQLVFHKFPSARCAFAFKNRGEQNLSHLVEKMKVELKKVCELRFKPEEISYLRSLKIFKEDYLNFLSTLELKFNDLEISEEQGALSIRVKPSVPWKRGIMYEIFVLATLSEAYTSQKPLDETQALIQLHKKIDIVKKNPKIKFADFGTRRRHSFNWHKTVIQTLTKNLPSSQFIGTSNVLLAKEFGITPIGTMAHEYFQGCQALAPSIGESQSFALEQWIEEYGDNLSVALSDIFGFDYFLADLSDNLKLAHHYKGIRHDSGDPRQWCNKLINFYKKNNIDPLSKTAVFSDGVNFNLANELADEYSGKINVSFGIGTNLTNDIPGEAALKIVMKMVTCNGHPVAKRSDSEGKSMCEDAAYVELISKIVSQRLQKN